MDIKHADARTQHPCSPELALDTTTGMSEIVRRPSLPSYTSRRRLMTESVVD
jgi:hypothetical protein